MRAILSLIRSIMVLSMLLLLTACLDTDNPVPADSISRLKGVWIQDDGHAAIHFYGDETIKLTMPDEQPPLRLLSSLEVIKDDQIGFGVGDRWNGPVYVELGKRGHSLQLVFHGDTERKLNFHRQP